MNVSNYALNYALVIHYTKEKFFVLATGPNNLPTYVQFFLLLHSEFFSSAVSVKWGRRRGRKFVLE